MLQGDVPERDLAAFVLPELGRLQETGDQWAPYQLLDQDGVVVDPVRVFFAELQAEDKPASTVRSYGMDLLRWWRFLWALNIEWNRATRTDARDFIRWMQIANKPQRLHWRHRKAG
ncbi:site-specific integrase [Streptomyces sp. NPDC052415]